jgi:hypothetical protein
MENTVTIVSPTLVVDLSKSRKAFVGGLVKTGELIKGYANDMCAQFDTITTKWFDLKGKLAKGVKEERALFVADMTEAGYETGTIDVYWGRVKDASGRIKSTNKVTGGTSVDDANIRDLKTILNRIDNAETESAPLSNKVVAILLMAADQMGIDTKAYAIGADTDEE